MNEMLLNILSVVVTAVIIPLISFLGYKFSQWLATKTKNEKAQALIVKANDIVLNAVKSTFQTYVDELKKKGTFDKDAQIRAFNMAKDTAIKQLGSDATDFIANNYGGLNEWLSTQIEASINQLKN